MNCDDLQFTQFTSLIRGRSKYLNEIDVYIYINVILYYILYGYIDIIYFQF